MPPNKLYFEDFPPNRVFEFTPKTVTAEEIVEFAREFDPQPMHLSAEAGKASILGGLAASGWHTSCIMMRMMIDAYLIDSTSEGAPGIDLMEWRRPVLAGDELSGRSTVTAARVMGSRPHLGIVTLTHVLENQRGERVLLSENSIMFRRRDIPGDAA